MKEILLIHGWNYRNYTSLTEEKDAWHNRQELIKELEKEYIVHKFNLPGFCGKKEPNERFWTLDDYAKNIENYIKKNKLNPNYILGYSFGSAIAIRWKSLYKEDQKLILISPAIIRNSNKSRNFIKTPKALNELRKFVRDLYLIYYVKTNEMKYGTPFLRQSYQHIVREDLKEELNSIKNEILCIIYGSKDDMVKPNEVKKFADKTLKNKIYNIKQGDHNIGTSHPNEILKIIKVCEKNKARK